MKITAVKHTTKKIMSNKKQGAVEWLASELKNHLDMPYKHFDELLEQAKEMEVKANADYFNRGFKQGLKTAIQRIEDEQ